MEKQIMKTPLKCDEAKEYCLGVLSDGNALAKELLKVVNFDDGKFFAVTAQSAGINGIYNFRFGGILPENPLETMVVLGKEYPARKKSTSVLELAQYLDELLGKNKNLWCLFEDLVRSKSDFLGEQTEENTAYFEEEVFYYLRGDEFSLEKGMHLIRYSNAQWYYMNVITSEPILSVQDNLTIELIRDIAAKTTNIVIGAYDMEGYVVWEKNVR